jgi:hypothetical protein
MIAWRVAVDDEHEVLLDLDFDDGTAVNGFLNILRRTSGPRRRRHRRRSVHPRRGSFELVDCHMY